jgi:hypothetical protein
MKSGIQRELEESRTAGRELALAIKNGTDIPTVPCPIRLQPGERCFGAGDVGVMQHLSAEVEWTQKRGGGWGIGSMLVMGAANAVGNSSRKAAARRQAAPQWRPVDRGPMWLTNQRFAIQGSNWIDLWHTNVNLSQCDGLTIELHLSGLPPTRLRTSFADWWYVMFQWVAFGILTMPEERPE